MTFRSTAFQSVPRLHSAARNHPPLRAGERSDAVIVLQGALIDLGFRMPRSVDRDGTPDGIYGRETVEAVQAFQRQRGLSVDGSAGRQTLTRLDEVHAKRFGAHATRAPAPRGGGDPVLPPVGQVQNAHFEPGHHDPLVGRDAGSGAWNSEEASAATRGKRALILSWAFRKATARYPGPDASRHLTHFMENTGTDLTFDLAKMVRESQLARRHYESEVYRAHQYVEALPAGEHLFTARRNRTGNNGGDSPNWYFGVGGYAAWGKGRAVVRENGGPRSYRLELIYKAADRYNWNGNASVQLDVPRWLEKYVGEGTMGDVDFQIEITDEELATFHRQGLAREYDMTGSMRRVFEWTHGNGVSKPTGYL